MNLLRKVALSGTLNKSGAVSPTGLSSGAFCCLQLTPGCTWDVAD